MSILIRHNRLLSALPHEEIDKLATSLELVTLHSGHLLQTSDAEATSVLFPTTAVIGHVMSMDNGDAIETMSVGSEGMYGASALLGHSIGNIDSYVRRGGEAQRLSARDFRHYSEQLPAFRAIVYRFIGSQVAALTQQLCCNTLHSALQRCATRLLLTADHSNSEAFDMTHDRLATILGGHRPAATLIAGTLARGGRIRYRHGKVEILDRVLLTNDACECYNTITACSERVFAA